MFGNFFGKKIDLGDKHINYFELSQTSYFSEKELKKLYQRFKSLNCDEKGVDMESFCCQPEVANCKLILLAFDALAVSDEDQAEKGSSPRIAFKEFVMLLSKFSPRSPIDEKTKFLYTCLTDHGIRPFDKGVYMKLMGELCDGLIPTPMIKDHIDVMWSKLTKNNQKKALSERAFGSFLSQFDILSVSTITM